MTAPGLIPEAGTDSMIREAVQALGPLINFGKRKFAPVFGRVW